MALKTGSRSSHPNCDLCDHFGIGPRPAEYDDKIRGGPWANLCQGHFATHGSGIGTHFILTSDQPEATHGLSFQEWGEQMEGHFRGTFAGAAGFDPSDVADYNKYFHLDPKEASQRISDEVEADPYGFM